MATKVYKPKRKISATESEEIKIPASSVDGLSTVATSGSYNDLSNKPTIPDVSGLMPKSGGTFTGEVKFGSTENFQGYYIKRMLGSLGIGTRYENLDSKYKDGTYHRMWRLRFPSGSSFWGKIKVTLYGDYSSFNASGVMSKSITCNFNTSNIYNNVGCYDGLGVNVEQDFRISEAIWNATANAWEVLIWQKNLSGNNPAVIMLECWTKNNTNYINAFNGIAAQTVELTQSTSYSAQKASPTGGTKTVEWATLPVYENPLGEEIATAGDLSNKANLSGGNTFTGKQTLNSPPSDGYSIDASGYVKGSWLQATQTSNKGAGTGKVCVFDGNGWIYYRTPAEILTEAGGVTQVKINGTTNSPDSAGLVDLGTVGGGQTLTATTVDLTTLSNGTYSWELTNNTKYTLSGIGNNNSQKFSFYATVTNAGGAYKKYIATLKVYKYTFSSVPYGAYELSYEQDNLISGKRKITYLYDVGKITEYTDYHIGGNESEAIYVLSETSIAANIKVTILPDATKEGETTNVTVSIGGVSSTNIKNITKSSVYFPMSLVFDKPSEGGLLISETALDGKFDSFGNSDDSAIYDDEIYVLTRFTSTRSSLGVFYKLNGTIVEPISYQ